ncbi:MAG: 50S ribosomal protein L10 [bacterium]|nr:50S ribosomal protein L10 [bacterium]
MKGTHKELMVKKGAILDELREKVAKASVIILADYIGTEKGLSVKDISELRNAVRKQDAEFKIAKNTLIAKVLKENGIEGLDNLLERPTAIYFGYGDPVAATKAIVEFAKTKKSKSNPEGLPVLKGGRFEGETLDMAGVRRLATMPSRDEVLAQLLSLINTPARNVMGIAQAAGRDILSIVDQYSKKEA